MGNPATKVGMNRHGLAELVLYGPTERVENVYREVKQTLRRLRRGGKLRLVKALEVPPRGAGGYPNLHDVMRWLDDMKNDELHEEEIRFARTVFVTAAKRCRPEVLKEA